MYVASVQLKGPVCLQEYACMHACMHVASVQPKVPCLSTSACMHVASV